jgi:hypothetical protein
MVLPSVPALEVIGQGESVFAVDPIAVLNIVARNDQHHYRNGL